MFVTMTILESDKSSSTPDPGPIDDQEQDPSVCTPNISKQERKKRLLFGLVTLVLSLIVLALLLVTGADRWWRLDLFLLFFGATVGFFQWREKT